MDSSKQELVRRQHSSLEVKVQGQGHEAKNYGIMQKACHKECMHMRNMKPHPFWFKSYDQG